MRQLKIGTSWVRGVVGDALTPEVVVNFSCAFGTWTGGAPVVIGRDTRRSSTAMRAAVVSGLLSTGCEVIDLGVSSSPIVSFAVRELGAGGGISITGSHNEAEWNALKFFGPDGALLNSAKTEELLDVYHSSAFLAAPWDRLKPLAEPPQGFENRYLEHILSALDVEAIRARRFRVAVDFSNGACGPIASRFFQALGCTLLPVNEDPAAEFAHPPAPTAANMRQLATLMRCFEADLGAAINVDGDRIGFVTREGTALSEEYALPLVAGLRLERRPGPVVTNLSTSRMVDAVAARYGQPVLRTAVGESHVVDYGVAEGAVLAGEGCGGVAPLPVTMTFDALLSLGHVFERLAASDKSLSVLAGELPHLHMRKRELPCAPNVVYRIVERFRLRHAEENPNGLDGVRVDWDDAWLHVRASNTEPVLRIIAEARTAERAENLAEEAWTFARRAAVGHVRS